MKFWSILLIGCCLLSLGGTTTYSTTLPTVTAQDETLIQLCQQDYRAQAVHCDTFFNFGWGNETNTNQVRLASKNAVKSLEQIKHEAEKITVPETLSGLKAQLLADINGLKGFYTVGRDQYGTTNAEQALTESWKVYDAATVAFRKTLDTVVTHSTEINPHLGIGVIDNNAGQAAEQFRDALKLYDAKQLKEAYAKCEALLPVVKATPLEHNCLVLLADMLLGMKSEYPEMVKLDPTIADKRGKQYLEQIVNSGLYSPVLAMSYRKWRATIQSHDNGMSNFSRIPNAMYDAQRVKVLRVIARHLQTHPNDTWGADQFYDLLTLPCLHRGTDFGNSNLSEWAEAFPQDNF